ncbi:MAG: hypothetical protein HWE16_18110, partial [Gammaproteobacteria bacterium]|nr:hypothetical protein [Gammaproteobacteria bacterium]
AGGTDAAIEWDSTVDCFDEGGLCTILLEIFEEVSSQGTSFVQAGVTVSQQNRLNHDNFLYFSQFQAEGIARWPGNLKKYQLVDGVLVDSDGKNAVGTDGLFLETRDENNIVTGGTSFWTDPNFPDGNQVESGGAVSKLSSFLSVTTDVNGLPIFDSFNRNIYTNKGNSEILLSDASIDKAAFGMAASTDDEFNDVKRQTLGYRLETRTLQDENGNDFDVKNVATSMNLMGDPLHSVPHVLRYANGKTLAFIGTNMGYLHAIDIDDGSESWSFIPSDLLPEMQNFLKDVDIDGNPEAHNYGLDGEITIVHSDTDLDFKVDSGELAYMFIGMRRGGNNYYVFDISSSSKPKYLYKISGLSHQAQSWSRMVIGNIEYGDTFKTVAIFGGGYDDLLDGLDTDSDGRSDSYNITYGKETTGNNVIIFDVVDKKVLWDLQGSSLPAKLQIGSVPGTIRAISLGNSPFANHMYVSDTKGQVFRFDISPTDSAFTVTGQRIANLGGTGTLLNNSDNRRFFYAPSVAKIRDEIFGQYIAIAIGSGYRAHPLDEEIEDQFYMIRDKAVYDSTPGFDAEANVNNLTDVTLEIDEDNVSATASADLLTSRGWKIDLSGDFGGSANPGEKVLSEARILNNKILFSTYIPSVSLPSAGSCSPVVGNGKLYGVNVQDGTSFFSDITRAIELNSPGIPPEPQVLIVDGQGIVCVGNECGDDNDDNYDTGDGNDKPIVEGEDFQQLVSAIIEKFSTIQRVKWKKKVDG